VWCPSHGLNTVIATTNIIFGTKCPRAQSPSVGLLSEAAKEVYPAYGAPDRGGASDSGSTIRGYLPRPVCSGVCPLRWSQEFARLCSVGFVALYY